jgi:GDP-D-mannose dehydratase
MLEETGDMQKICEAMWLMLQQETPDDYVIATGNNILCVNLLKSLHLILDLILNGMVRRR